MDGSWEALNAACNFGIVMPDVLNHIFYYIDSEKCISRLFAKILSTLRLEPTLAQVSLIHLLNKCAKDVTKAP